METESVQALPSIRPEHRAELVERVIREMGLRGWTTTDLSEVAGIAYAQVWRFMAEKNRNRPIDRRQYRCTVKPIFAAIRDNPPSGPIADVMSREAV